MPAKATGPLTRLPISRADIVAKARECIDTPFRHQGRIPGLGLDCAGVVLFASNSLGYTSGLNIGPYGHFPDQRIVKGALAEHLDLKPRKEMAAADVVVFAYGNHGIHMGILGEKNGKLTIIHSSAILRAVREHEIGDDDRIVAVYGFRGIED